jgi:hypothetical protein
MKDTMIILYMMLFLGERCITSIIFAAISLFVSALDPSCCIYTVLFYCAF